MWQNKEVARGSDGNLNNWEPPSAGGDVLTILTELNELCLELLAQQALQPVSPNPPMFRELVDLWSQLDSTSRRRAAACPYLLIDAGFCDPYRWQVLSDQQASARTGVHDREPAPFVYSRFFTAPGVTRVARQVFTNSWHIVQTQQLGAPLFLGMPAHCAALLRTCSMRQMTDLADQHAGWLRPRWPGRTRVWRELLEAGISGEVRALEMARLHGVQMLAMELKALDRVKDAQAR
ncbi:MAG: hypothetical protein QOI59_6026 [Gammaproteobacteria bacterium]|jgi:hypothetical protein|nr:hypothetical protein [Gammaproteobacteria bacterium]